MPTEPEAHGAGPGPAASSERPAAPTDAAAPPPADTLTEAAGGAGGNGEQAPGPVPKRRRRGRIVAWIVALLAAAFLVGAAVVPLPYYLFKPGSVRAVEPLISVKGTHTYPSKGTIGYTTVSLRQATLLGLVQGWIDDDIDVIGRDEVLQGRNVRQNQQLNLQMMTNSKQVAAQVALEKLGYDVHVTVGQLIDQVLPDSPADGVLQPGDTIVAVDGHRFDEAEDLTRLVSARKPGDKVTVTVRPQGSQAERRHELTLEPSPDDPTKGVMGVRIVPVAIDYDFPFDIAIDTGNVGGPSAGLAFTLGIIDALTPGDLTGGKDVAITGTMSPDGTVGPVGGSGQKAAAVRNKGIKLFIVPRSDYKDARARAGKSLKVVPVDNLDDALKVLADNGGNADDLPQIGKQEAKAAA
ncbi:MAG TPA: S16 family serine protease [Acidimicrobiales bacterium]|nr:S16 family serine protease [Acidimicrobiales bacterium]